MTKPIVESLFPIPLYVADGYKINPQKKKRLLKETFENQEPNESGNILSRNHYVLESPYLSAFKKYLTKQIDIYVYEVLCLPKTVEVYITQSWLNINPSDSTHHVHHHFNSFVSGTYYLQGDTPINFIHNNQIFQNFDFDVTRRNRFNTSMCHIPVKEGRCLLFPSILHHSVGANNNKEERISLAFNTFIKGNLKPDTDKLVELTLK